MDGKVLIFAYLLLVLGMNDAATTVKHSHIRGNDKSKERTEDGSYSPRDAHHHEDGEHHSEFDHEAILGTWLSGVWFVVWPDNEFVLRS